MSDEEQRVNGNPTHDVEATAEEMPDVPGEEIAPYVPQLGGAIIRAEQPEEMLEHAARIADALKGLIEKQKLAIDVGGGRKHVEVGGWQALGFLLGTLGGLPLHAETVWTRLVCTPAGEPIRRVYTANVKRYYSRRAGGGLKEEITYDVDGHDWEACVQVLTPDAVVAGRAEAMCSRSEATWAQRDEFAVRSMAETRAESRAYRRACGWIVKLAGYEPTPAEEMGHTPGAPTSEPEMPAWAKAIDADGIERLRGALAYLLGDEPRGDRVERVGFELAQLCGGMLPEVALQAIRRTAVVAKRHHDAQQAAADTEPRAEAAA